VGLAGVHPAASFLALESTAVAIVAELQLGGFLLGAQNIEALAGAEARVGGAGVNQLLDMLAVDLGTLALAVGAARSAHIRSLVPLEPEPGQSIEDHSLALDRAALAVRILDTKDEAALLLTSESVIEERDVGRTDVWVAGRTGRDSGSHGIDHQ